MGEIVKLWVKRAKSGPMDAVAEAKLVAGRGIVGNANQGGRRQVTIIDERAWADAIRDVGVDVDPSARRANILVRGLDLENSGGRILRLGSILIRLFAETRPCELMDEMQPGLRAALKPHWRGGAYGEILEDGILRVGDRAEWV